MNVQWRLCGFIKGAVKLKLGKFIELIDWELKKKLPLNPFSRLIKELFQVPFPIHKRETINLLPNCSVIFFVIHPNHVRFLLPVIDEMTRCGTEYQIFTYSGDVQEKLKSKGYESFLWSHSIAPLTYLKVAMIQMVYYFMISLDLLFDKSKQQELAGLVKFYKTASLLQFFAKKHILGNEEKKLVLFKAEGFQARVILSEAMKSKKVRSYAIQHGLIDGSSQFSNLTITKYLVWSDYFAERLRSANAGCEIEVCGNPVYDDVFHKKKEKLIDKKDHKEFRLLLLPNSGNSHTSVEQVYLLLESCIKALNEMPELRVWVKPHPGDVNGNVKNHLINNFANQDRMHLISRNDPVDFDICDVVVINNSAAGMEAAIWGKPLIVVANKIEEVMVPQYLEKGIASFANDFLTLRTAIESIRLNYELIQEKCEDFCDEQLAFHGNATQKILSELRVK